MQRIVPEAIEQHVVLEVVLFGYVIQDPSVEQRSSNEHTLLHVNQSSHSLVSSQHTVRLHGQQGNYTCLPVSGQWCW